MARSSKVLTVVKASGKVDPTARTRKSSKIVRTATDFAGLMTNLMADLIEGKVSPQIGNAVCNAGGKLLKIVDMQHRYGKSNPLLLS